MQGVGDRFLQALAAAAKYHPRAHSLDVHASDCLRSPVATQFWRVWLPLPQNSNVGHIDMYIYIYM